MATMDRYNKTQLAKSYHNPEMGVTKTLEEWADNWDDFSCGSFGITDFGVFKSEHLEAV